MSARILIVDDEESARTGMQLLLEQKGYEILCAEDGVTALKLIDEKKPDLILLDIVMPEIDGYQLCDLLKKKQEYREIPVIMITAKSQKKDIFWALEKGAEECLTKPIDPISLLKVIKKLLDERITTKSALSSPGKKPDTPST